MNVPTYVVHLLSGGLDSVAMLYDHVQAGNQVHCLLFDYRQRHKQELQWAKHHASRLRCPFTVMDLPELGGLTEQSWVVPNRNAIFLSIAVNFAAQANADVVTIGCNLDDSANFPDCRPEFIEAMNAAVRAAGYKVEICAPYLRKAKWEIGDIARQLGVAKSDVWTCYKGGQSPCGECPACQKLATAFLK